MFGSIIWDIYAWSYDSGVNSIGIYSNLIESVIRKLALSKNDIVLDLGCGTGNLENEILTKNKQFKKIIALDISESMLKRAKRKVQSPKVFFKRHDINKRIPVDNESVDKVVMIHALYAMEDPDYVLGEINRVLKQGGKLVVANPFDANGGKKIKENVFSGMSLPKTVYTYLTKLPVIGVNKVIEKMAKGKRYHFIKDADMSKLLEKNGFEVPEVYEKAYADTDILFITSKK